MSRPPILIATPGFPADEADTTCMPYVQDLLKALREACPHQPIAIVSLHYPARRGRYVWHGCDVIALAARNRRWPWRVLDLARAYRALSALDARQPSRLVHAFLLTDAACVAGQVARRRGRRFLATLLGQDALAGNRWLRLLPPHAEVVAISPRSAEAFRQSTGRSACHLVPAGVAACAGPATPWSGRPIDLLGLGSLHALKDFATFVEIAAQLTREGLVRRAVILGDGPQRAQLARQAAALGVALELPGQVSREQATDTLRHARVLLHPSRFEGFGLIFAEALARHTPIVSRAVGIAQPSPRWRIGETMSELLEANRTTLAAAPAPGDWPQFPLASTLQAYLRLYGLERG